MARLPDADALGQRPTPQGTRSIAQADLSAVPKAIVGVAQLGIKYAEERDREDDRRAVFAARRQLDDWERTALYDPQKGAINKRGKDAFGLPDLVQGDFDKAAGEIAATLRRPSQQRAFNELATSRRAQVLDWAAKHAIQEKKAYDLGEFKADLDSFEQRAAQDPSKAQVEIELQRQRIIGFMRSNGRSEQEINQALTESSSKTHMTVIQSMMDANNAEAAKKYFDANAGGMLDTDRHRVKKGMEEVIARGRAQAFGDDVMARGLSLADALKEARSKLTGKDEEAAVHELKTRYDEQEVIASRAKKETADKAWSIVLNGGGRKNIPQSLWDQLDPSTDQKAILDYTEAKWRRAKADAEGRKEEDFGTYMLLRDMARENPEAFAKTDLARYMPNLSKRQAESLMDIKDRVGKGESKAMGELKTATDVERMVKADMQAAGFDLSPKEGSAKAKELAAFRGALYLSIDEEIKQKGRPLTDGEKRELGMRLLREGIEQGSGIFFADKKRGYQIVNEGPSGKSYVLKSYSDIPPDVRAGLEAEIAARPGTLKGRDGKPILSKKEREEVERMYTRGVELGRFK